MPDRRDQFVEWLEDKSSFVFSFPRYVFLGGEDLRTAAAEARREASAGRSRPYGARRAPSSMALLCMALEAWANGMLTRAWIRLDGSLEDQACVLKLIRNDSLDRKLRHLPRYLASGEPLAASAHEDLKALISVRHELIHDLPASNQRGEIDRLDFLDGRDLLSEPSDAQGRYMLYERLETYDLAWWAWETALATVVAIKTAVGDDGFLGGLRHHNFDLPQQWSIPSPTEIEVATKGR